MQWKGLERGLFEGECRFYLQKRRNLGWNESPTGQNGPGEERTPGLPGSVTLDEVVRDEEASNRITHTA
jgi:hypothetical protein